MGDIEMLTGKAVYISLPLSVPCRFRVIRGHDGFSFLRTVSSTHPAYVLPVIYINGHSNKSFLKKGGVDSCVIFIERPVLSGGLPVFMDPLQTRDPEAKSLPGANLLDRHQWML